LSLSFDRLAWAAVLYHSTESDELTDGKPSDKLNYAGVVDLLQAVPSGINEKTVTAVVGFPN